MVHDPKRFGRVPRATVYILAAFLIIELGFTVNKRMPSLASFSRPRNLTLVVYAYHETDEVRQANLEYFLRHGVLDEDSDTDFLFVINGGKVTPSVPSMRNVQVLRRPNEGEDFGAWASGLNATGALTGQGAYHRYILLNSSVRGPFLPAYVDTKQWVTHFTELISGDVKLAGCTINCCCKLPPHVSTYVIVTDAEGIQLAARAGVFTLARNTSHFDLIRDHEVGFSRAVLAAGYNIASLLLKYDGVDWRKPEYAKCNGEVSPLVVPRGYDGMMLHPLEVIFVKAKRSEPGWLAMVEKYQAFPRHRRVVEYDAPNDHRKELRDFYLAATARCNSSFDRPFYLKMNADIGGSGLDPEFHWLNHGWFERRVFRIVVPPNAPSECALLANASSWLPRLG